MNRCPRVEKRIFCLECSYPPSEAAFSEDEDQIGVPHIPDAMIVKTANSTYTFQDNGDNTFEMTSTNKKYAGPVKMTFYMPCKVGFRCYAVFREGPRENRLLITTPVLEIS